ncbi:MAG: BON domain-containing protein [Rubrivivax sp.]|nr:BON domain-containing protein [Rubrivivax sp.]
MTLPLSLSRWTLGAAAAALFCGALAGCAPLLVGGAVVGGGLIATDRRTAGTQLEDEGIEARARTRVRELATLGHVNATSYNRTVLLTGEVPGVAEKAAVEQAVAKVENVRTVVNELGVGPSSSLGSRSTDLFIAGKVKATLLDAKDVQANAYKVVVERAVVHLMGRVTEREAARGVELARSVSGVQKVVRVFELLTEQELAALGSTRSGPAASAAPTAVPVPATPAPVSAPVPPPVPMPAPTPLPTK